MASGEARTRARPAAKPALETPLPAQCGGLQLWCLPQFSPLGRLYPSTWDAAPHSLLLSGGRAVSQAMPRPRSVTLAPLGSCWPSGEPFRWTPSRSGPSSPLPEGRVLCPPLPAVTSCPGPAPCSLAGCGRDLKPAPRFPSGVWLPTPPCDSSGGEMAECRAVGQGRRRRC